MVSKENQSITEASRNIISLKDINLIYKSSSTRIEALKGINLDIDEGEFICVLGPSGCGKSTLLKIIAGFIDPSKGSAVMDGNVIKGPDWHRGVVFQQPPLYPWLDVKDNVKFGLKMRKIPQDESNKKVDLFLEKVGLTEFSKHKPYELSGGMKQRVAIARVLVNNPRVLLMDEPFGALDALTREQMQNLLRNIWLDTKKTIFFITHDVDEALSLGTKVIVMSKRPGKIVKEFNVNFTNSVDNEEADSIRFNKEFQKLRREILSLINNN